MTKYRPAGARYVLLPVLGSSVLEAIYSGRGRPAWQQAHFGYGGDRVYVQCRFTSALENVSQVCWQRGQYATSQNAPYGKLALTSGVSHP